MIKRWSGILFVTLFMLLLALLGTYVIALGLLAPDIPIIGRFSMVLFGMMVIMGLTHASIGFLQEFRNGN